MIIWLASYPRSGNTFLRIVLKHAYGLNTYSLHNDTLDIAKNQKTSEIVGHQHLSKDFDFDNARQSPELFLIKTHDAPVNNTDKAIYLIRDGRDVLNSYINYKKNYLRKSSSIEDLIFSNDIFGGWTQHIEKWEPESRENTLIVRFEDLVSNPVGLLPSISKFLGVSSSDSSIPGFDDLQEIDERFFRRGIRGDRSDFSESAMDMFTLKNHKTMEQFSYASKLNEEECFGFKTASVLSRENDYIVSLVSRLMSRIDILEKGISRSNAIVEDRINNERSQLMDLKERVNKIKPIFQAAEKANELRPTKNPARYLSRRIKLIYAVLFKL